MLKTTLKKYEGYEELQKLRKIIDDVSDLEKAIVIDKKLYILYSDHRHIEVYHKDEDTFEIFDHELYLDFCDDLIEDDEHTIYRDFNEFRLEEYV